MHLYPVLLLQLYLILSACALQYKNKSGYRVFFLWLGLTLIVTFRPAGNVMFDYQNYVNMYKHDEYTVLTRFEPTLAMIRSIARCIYDSPLTFFFIYAALAVALKLYAIKETSSFFWWSTAIYLSYVFLKQDMVQIRTAVATGLLLCCVKPLYERKFFQFMILVIIAFLFHNSSIVMICLWFLKPRSMSRNIYILIILAGFACMCMGISFTSLIKYIPIDFVQVYYEKYGSSTARNWKGIILLAVRAIVYVYMITKIDFIESKNKYAYLISKIYALSLLVGFLFHDNMVIFDRISELFGVVEILFIPLLIYRLSRPVKYVVPFCWGLVLLIILCFASDHFNYSDKPRERLKANNTTIPLFL